MPSLIKFFGAIFGTSKRLSHLEKMILDSVCSTLPVDIRGQWKEQVQSINKVQRLPGGVEVNFYRMKNRRAVTPVGLAFTNKKEELHLATVRITLANVEEPLEAKVWCVKGILFMIVYEGSVDYFEEAANTDVPESMTFKCTLLANLQS